MRRVLVIIIATLVFNGCIAVVESHGPGALGRFGPSGLGEPGWVRPPTVVCFSVFPCPR